MGSSRLPAPPLRRALLGYPAGVAAATLAVEAFAAAESVFASGFGRASVAHQIREAVVFGLVFALMAAVAAALPCLAAECLARLLGIRSAWWFALWGAAAGLGAGTLTVALPNIVQEYADALRTFGAMFGFSGAMGGLAYWWVSRRLPVRPLPGPAPAQLP